VVERLSFVLTAEADDEPDRLRLLLLLEPESQSELKLLSGLTESFLQRLPTDDVAAIALLRRTFTAAVCCSPSDEPVSVSTSLSDMTDFFGFRSLDRFRDVPLAAFLFAAVALLRFLPVVTTGGLSDSSLLTLAAAAAAFLLLLPLPVILEDCPLPFAAFFRRPPGVDDCLLLLAPQEAVVETAAVDVFDLQTLQKYFTVSS